MPRSSRGSNLHDPVLCALDHKAYQQWCYSDAADNSLLRMALPKAFSSELTQTQKQYAVDYYVSGMTLREIGLKYGVHYSTVCRTLSRVRTRLKHVLRYSSIRTLNST